MSKTEIKTQVAVLGSGPGGYSAAFRAADLGKQVVLIERYESIGGVCLNVGCIPSKALLHLAEVIEDAHEVAANGIEFGEAKIDFSKVIAGKNKVVTGLTGGLKMLAKQRQIQIVTGVGKFISPNQIEVTASNGDITVVSFENAIIAAGSRPVKLPFIPEDPRIMDSTGALELENVKSDLLVIGGGIIGCEMATVYQAFGAKVSIVEFMDQIMPGADRDVVAPLAKRLEKRMQKVMLKTKVTKVEAKPDGLYVTFEGENAPEGAQKFDRILVAVGRRPNTDLIAADKAGVNVNERGFVVADKQLRTNVPHIFAIGDIIGNPMLAHKASAEGRTAAEVIAGMKHYFEPKTIPSVAYTNPEIAWTGITETEAKAKGIKYGKGVFPWAASGRALSMGRSEGLTKLLFDEETHRVIGGAVVGPNAGELIGEITLAIEMGCDAGDIALTIHPHPTLSESIMMAAEMYEGTITDLYVPKKKK